MTTYNHKAWVIIKIGEHGKQTLKPTIMSDLIHPKMRGWLNQILPEPDQGLWMMAQVDYRTIFCRHWRPQGVLIYTQSELRALALALPKYNKMGVERLA